jgi:predicted metal-dependent hydrolase
MPPYSLCRQRRKTVSILIDRNGELLVKAPYGVKTEQIERFLSEKSAWIAKKTAEILLNKQKYDGFGSEWLYFLGERYTVAVRDGAKRAAFDHDGRVITVPILRKTHYLILFYKRECLRFIAARLEEFTKITGLRHTSVLITDSKTYWGNCNAKGRLRFNARLVMLPRPLIDYVLLHELCHIKYLNHSKQFWALLCGFLPDYKNRKSELKSYTYIQNALRE